MRSATDRDDLDDRPERIDRYLPRLLLDGYVDRTFNAAPEVLAAVGVLPYVRPWIGFVHHTFSPANGGSSVACLLKQPLFAASLPACRCLVVFSRNLATQLEAGLALLTPSPPPVRVLTHPTETPPPERRFGIVSFMRNAERKVVQIGAWLRQAYAIYDLPLPVSNWWSMTKAVLHGPLMGGSVPPPDFGRLMAAAVAGMYQSGVPVKADKSESEPTLGQVAQGRGRRGRRGAKGDDGVGAATDWMPPPLKGHDGRSSLLSRPWEMCRDWSAGDAYSSESFLPLPPFLRSFLASTEARDRSVSVLPHMHDDAYDDMLSCNVVFLALEDASAVNTVLECAVRNTPVVVNRLPALEELLGKAYPGFYETGDLETAVVLLTTRIMDMTMYLSELDKSALALDVFVSNFHALLVEVG